MDRNGPNYRNILPEWTLICGFEIFLCAQIGESGLELPQKVISPRNMQFRYRKKWIHGGVVTGSLVTAWVTVAVPRLLIQHLLINNFVLTTDLIDLFCVLETPQPLISNHHSRMSILFFAVPKYMVLVLNTLYGFYRPFHAYEMH